MRAVNEWRDSFDDKWPPADEDIRMTFTRHARDASPLIFRRFEDFILKFALKFLLVLLQDGCSPTHRLIRNLSVFTKREFYLKSIHIRIIHEHHIRERITRENHKWESIEHTIRESCREPYTSCSVRPAVRAATGVASRFPDLRPRRGTPIKLRETVVVNIC